MTRGRESTREALPDPIGRMPPREDGVFLRVGEAQMLLDGVRRAVKNVEQCESICESAAKAFRMERTALEESETLLQELLCPADASSQTSILLAEGAGRR